MIKVGIHNVSLRCDACKETYKDIHRGINHFIDSNLILLCAKEDGWISINNKHYCPNCYIQNVKDNIMPNEMPIYECDIAIGEPLDVKADIKYVTLNKRGNNE